MIGDDKKYSDTSPEDVEAFHAKDDVDVRGESHHHTLGIGSTQAAAGDHRHTIATGNPLFQGEIISGAKGGNAALASVIALLVSLGATDSTT